jgi:alkyldihydroxyacetonephosphate synthase
MDYTYRQILKWGDKREEKVDPLMIKIIREKFDLKDSDFQQKYLSGSQTVKLEKPSSLKPGQIDFFKSLAGNENVQSDDFSRAKFSCGKFYAELLDMRLNLVPNPPDAVVSPKSFDELVKIAEY